MENRNVLKSYGGVIAAIAIVVLAAVMRLMPHLPNVAPIAALALFSGAHMKGVRAYAFPFFAMVLADSILGWHNTIFYVYGSFFLLVFVGRFVGKKPSIPVLAATSLTASLLFFFITNFGVWVVGGLYPKTLSGLQQSFIMGIPFLRNTLVGDAFYVFSFFYGYRFLCALLERHGFDFNKNTS